MQGIHRDRRGHTVHPLFVFSPCDEVLMPIGPAACVALGFTKPVGLCIRLHSLVQREHSSRRRDTAQGCIDDLSRCRWISCVQLYSVIRRKHYGVIEVIRFFFIRFFLRLPTEQVQTVQSVCNPHFPLAVHFKWNQTIFRNCGKIKKTKSKMSRMPDWSGE